MRALLFNPENDLALAAESVGNRVHFTPPNAALKIRKAGALLPLWWAKSDDVVILPPRLSPSEVSSYRCEAEKLCKKYGLQAYVATPEELKKSGEFRMAHPLPWGWSRYARHLFDEAGIIELPSDTELNEYAMLSHRRTTIEINKKLRSMLTSSVLPGNEEKEEIVLPPLPVEAFSIDEIVELVSYWGSVMVKLPWSCSSRGVVRINSDDIDGYIPQLSGMLKRQGSVMVEQYLDGPTDLPDRDFAALFVSDGHGKVEFRAWSVFKTDEKGRYIGNIVALQSMLQDKIHLPKTIASKIITALETTLSEVIGNHYKGWFGIDMMHWATSDGIIGIAPCVEINLRYTMGVASYFVADKIQHYSAYSVSEVGTAPSVSVFPMTLNVLPQGIILR